MYHRYTTSKKRMAWIIIYFLYWRGIGGTKKIWSRGLARFILMTLNWSLYYANVLVQEPSDGNLSSRSGLCGMLSMLSGKPGRKWTFSLLKTSHNQYRFHQNSNRCPYVVSLCAIPCNRQLYFWSFLLISLARLARVHLWSWESTLPGLYFFKNWHKRKIHHNLDIYVERSITLAITPHIAIDEMTWRIWVLDEWTMCAKQWP